MAARMWLSESTKRRIVRAYRDTDTPVEELAAEFDVSDRTIYRVAKKAGVKTRCKQRWMTPEQHKEVQAELVRLRSAGSTWAEVAAKLGFISKHAAFKYARRFRLYEVPGVKWSHAWWKHVKR